MKIKNDSYLAWFLYGMLIGAEVRMIIYISKMVLN